jgi:hypothetical protein
MKRALSNAVMIVFFTALLMLGADRAVGAVSLPEARVAGIISQPHIHVSYRTSEFSSDVVMNNLGFRDRDVRVEKGPATRILAIGDSFTYGWGVAQNEPWPKVLERNLQADGMGVEVLDLGESGAYPRTYADIAERAVPLLRPDLVIVAILQGDDLAQSLPTSLESLAEMSDAALEATPRRRVRAGVLSFFNLAYPNLNTLVARRALNPVPVDVDINSQWRDQAQRLLDGLTPDQRERYGRIDREAEEMLLAGNLNPSLVALSLRHPEFYADTLHPEKPDVAVGIVEMGRQLARIKRVADGNGAQVLVTSVPFGTYSSQRQLGSRAALGFTVEPSMLGSDVPDMVIERAVDQAGLVFEPVTYSFRGQRDDTELYFLWDGHFTAAGQEHYGTALAPLVKHKIAARTGSF